MRGGGVLTLLPSGDAMNPDVCDSPAIGYHHYPPFPPCSSFPPQVIQTAWFLTTATLRRLISDQLQQQAEESCGGSDSAAVEAVATRASEAARTGAAAGPQQGVVALSSCEEIFRRLGVLESACGGCERYRDECVLLLQGRGRAV